MHSRRLIIHGAGGHGKVVAEAAASSGWYVLGFTVDGPGGRDGALFGLPILACSIDELHDLCLREDACAVLAVGDNAARRDVFERCSRAGIPLATIVHRGATVSPSARLGRGVVVLAGAAINADAEIGADAIVNTAASVDHDAVLEDHVHISPGAHLGGGVRIGEGSHVGIGASVRNNVAIGRWSVIGAGSAVVGDIPDRVVAYGVPARIVRPNA